MATLRLYQVSARGLASEPDARGGTGWPGLQNDSYSPSACATRARAKVDFIDVSPLGRLVKP